ncbi:tellurite resistance TerB family protein [Gaopeijia maritima]|uniref:TerB family tellurite resistance protein n=1 Tax=Gaopeijia maritima TaxID=3119007 RepID=A0ABU9ECC5_9BACT
MIDTIREFFRSSMLPADDAPPQTRDRDLRLAACALLLELAHADDDFSGDERRHMERSIRRHFGLDERQAEELLRHAETARQEAPDLWRFTRLIREHYSLGQKMVLAEVMWALVYSDGELHAREDYLMRKVSKLLALDMGYLSEARRRAECTLELSDPPVD